MTAGSWRVESVSVRNFRRHEELSIAFEPGVTALVGLNGSGKTSVLDALAVGLGTVLAGLGGTGPGFGTRDARIRLGDLGSQAAVATLEPVYPVSVTTQAVLAGSSLEWVRKRSSAQGHTTPGDVAVRRTAATVVEMAQEAEGGPVLPVIAYYGVERLVGVRRDQGRWSASRLAAYEAALDSKSDMARLTGYLRTLTEQVLMAAAQGKKAPAAESQLAAVDEACRRAIEPFGWHSPAWNPVVGGLTMVSTQGGETLPLTWLSSGVQITAGLVIDLASRMARANPSMGGSFLLDTTPGIVLIDEVDLHLHPQWQQHIVPTLRRTFPQVQFVITTHSPQVLSTVAGHEIRILDGDTVRTPPYAEGLRSDIVLAAIQETSPVPDTENRRALNDYLTLVYHGQGDSPGAWQLRTQLDDEMGGVANVPELADADAYREFTDIEPYDADDLR